MSFTEAKPRQFVSYTAKYNFTTRGCGGVFPLSVAGEQGDVNGKEMLDGIGDDLGVEDEGVDVDTESAMAESFSDGVENSTSFEVRKDGSASVSAQSTIS